MKLIDLDPWFVRYLEPDGDIQMVDSIEQAQGLLFLCPKCFSENHGPEGTHGILCWSESQGAPADACSIPGRRLALKGTGFADLTLDSDPGSKPILLTSGCHWNGFVMDGEVIDA
jgi:hypothetical protein